MDAQYEEILKEIEEKPYKQEAVDFLLNALAVYVNKLDKLVLLIEKDRSPDLHEGYFRELQALNQGIIQRGESVCAQINDKVIVKKIRELFRLLRPKYYYCSEIMESGYVKRYGYPGDHEMMTYVYQNKYVSKNKLGKYWDRYFLENAYAESVRGRKNKMVEILAKTINEYKGRTLKILNLPCGPARDIKEFIESGNVRTDIEVDIHCIDQDPGALRFAEESFINSSDNIKIHFAQGDILKFVRRMDDYVKELGRYDYVYSIGLADYLTDKLLKNMILFSWKLLAPKGKITYAFKIHSRDPDAPLGPKWYCDWMFVPRDLEQSRRMVIDSGIDGFEMEGEVWEETKKIVFLTARKK